MFLSRAAGLLLGAGIVGATFGAVAQVDALPDWLESRSSELTAEQREFLVKRLDGGDNKGLVRRLRTKNAEQIAAYVEGMMTIAEESKFDPETDMASIPLNTESDRFNSWKVRRPKGMDPYREPGPINLSYYAGGRGGINTFAGAPVAVYPEDLVAGEIDVAIVGAPLDMGSGMRGAKHAPSRMREVFGMGGVDMYTMVDPSEVLNIVDYGDIAIDNMSTELSMHHVRERVAEIAETGAIPFIVGGDHSLEYSDIAGLADVHGKKSFGVVHFDSHYDAGKGGKHYITHGQPVYRAVKEGHVDPRNYIQVGLRGPWPGAEGFEWMRNNGMRYHTMPEVEKKGWETVMEDALREARDSGKAIYISFDVDVLDPAFVPGTGTPVPGGLTMREAIPIVRRLCAENELVGFEIVEVAPLLDPTYRTAMNANFIVHACLTGVAMRKEGITQVGFLSDLTTEHMQPGAGEASADEDREAVDPSYATDRKGAILEP
ncbi:arginase [Pacificimonas flava]|uniref:Arginase n=2 Tax=Pacificimonas TaxID=1960290 RepID=A0A219B0P9_9SPHN|nr:MULTISPECIES: agmatinase family protein [Pacificimonas]MBZ6379622.1 agmatinase family protein [Pacificimonas aurantium]OWV31907.1 arginase [Pacificimonas flava]